MIRPSLTFWLTVAFLFGFTTQAEIAHGHHLLPRHELNCGKDFPCPKELHRRIDFWIHVFKGWGKKIAILHDPDVPHRVYAAVDTGDGCSSRVKSKVTKAKKNVKTGLYNAALKMENNEALTSTDIHYAELFKGHPPDKLRRAAENIRCQSGVRDGFLLGLERFGKYSYLVDTILAQYSLPSDIRYLPFVESSYNPAAYSKAGAAGMWQIMPKTARSLGLELDATVDERLDPEAATHGAARYLVSARSSLSELARSIDPDITDQEINPFVITSYNYGVNGMRRAIKSVNTSYLDVLDNYKSPAFQVAVKNFYSSFLAARHVSLNAHMYFDDVNLSGQLKYNNFVLKNATSVDRIKKVFQVSEEDLKPLNLGLTRFIWHGWRMVPAGYQLKLPYRTSGYQIQIEKLNAMTPETEAPGSGKYVVRKGDTACGIARGLRVNCRELININQLGKRALIQIGQELIIPKKLVLVPDTSGKGRDETVIAVSSDELRNPNYVVKRGDTACEIATRYGVSCRELIRVNSLGRRATIYIGQKLTIPGLISESGVVTGLDENNRYLVRKGDTACEIAQRFSVGCSELRKLNGLNKRATIYPGQKLAIPGLELPDTTTTAEGLANLEQTADQSSQSAYSQEGNNALANLLDTLPDLSISVTDSGGMPSYRIWVEPDETLGHYADWMGVGSTRTIRELNNISSSQGLQIGSSIKLPISTAEMVTRFEQRRSEYHQVLSEELKEHYDFVGIQKHKVRSGESVWTMSSTMGFPMWLFYRLNPTLGVSKLKVGQIVLLPNLQEK